MPEKNVIQFRCLRGTHLPAALDARAGDSLSRHEIARRDLERYYALLRRELASLWLTEAEARLICNACSGWVLTRSDDPAALWLQVENGEGTMSALGRRLRAFTPGQLWALADAVERFWLAPDEPGRLAAIGLTLRPSAGTIGGSLDQDAISRA